MQTEKHRATPRGIETTADLIEAGRRLARESRAEQGLPRHVEDEATLAKIAAVVQQAT
jgi:hypothetical protein